MVQRLSHAFSSFASLAFVLQVGLSLTSCPSFVRFCWFFIFRFPAIFHIFVFLSSMLHWFSTPVVGCIFFFSPFFSGACLWFRDIVMCLFDMLMVQRHDHVFLFFVFSISPSVGLQSVFVFDTFLNVHLLCGLVVNM